MKNRLTHFQNSSLFIFHSSFPRRTIMSKDEASEVIHEVVEKQPNGTKKKSRLRRIGRIFGVLFVLFVIWYIFVGRSVPPRISKETTWVTEPRTPDGKWIDYCGAYEQIYYPPEMKTDDNGYRIIARHLGLSKIEMTYLDVKTRETKPYEFDHDALRAQGYEKLGLDPQNKPDMKLVTHYDGFFKDYANEIHPDDEGAAGKLVMELNDRVMNSPWTLEEYPMMESWLEQASPVLDMLSEAVAKPAFCVPLIVPEGYESLQLLMINGSLTRVQDFRSFAREFQVRFQYRLGKGDIDGAIEDKVATQRLGRHIGRQGILIAYLVGLAIEGTAYMEGIADNLDAPPTAEQIRRLMQLHAELPSAMTIDEAMESERLVALDSLQRYARGTPSSPVDAMTSPIIRFFFKMPYDWNIVMSRANKYLSGELKPKKPTVTSTIGNIGLSIFSRNYRSECFIDILTSLLDPAVESAREAQRRLDCQGNMQQITLAMLLYNAEHGTLPPAFSVDDNGKPLHSWRVLLLPYLGDEELATLYEQIRLDEPWNSEHNRQFHEKSLNIYRCPTAGLEPGKTSYCVILGDETPFGKDGRGKSLDAFGPNSGDMPLVAERRASTNWMDPTFDVTFEQAKEGISCQKMFEYDANNPHLPKENTIGSYHTGGANFGLRSGGVSFLSETIDQKLWQNILTGKEKMR